MTKLTYGEISGRTEEPQLEDISDEELRCNIEKVARTLNTIDYVNTSSYCEKC